jgi:hypothetical protein
MTIRALTMYDHVPGGCILQPVTDDDNAPHLCAGEFAIVDTTDTEPQHGEVYLVRFHRPGRWPNPFEEVFYIQQIMVRRHLRPGGDGETFIGFSMQCLNFEPYAGRGFAYREIGQRRPGLTEISHRSMAWPVLKEDLIGRVIGIYQARQAVVGGKNEP